MDLEVKYENKSEITQAGNYLWKYIDLHKYLSFLRNPSLFVTLIDLFNDLMEGLSHNHISNLNKYKVDLNTNGEEININSVFKKNVDSEINKTQELRYANCMFLGEDESVAMWNLYSSPGSVVLKIEPGSLINAIEDSIQKLDIIDSIETIQFGKVDYTSSKVKIKALRKHKSYSHENIVRLILKLKHYSGAFGHHITLNSNYLNYRIICHPQTPDWQFDNLSEFTINYLNVLPEHSILRHTFRTSII